jgi:hypothetical protein
MPLSTHLPVRSPPNHATTGRLPIYQSATRIYQSATRATTNPPRSLTTKCQCKLYCKQSNEIRKIPTLVHPESSEQESRWLACWQEVAAHTHAYLALI